MMEIQADDRVLVCYLPRPADFNLLQAEGWYRIPAAAAPPGLFADFYAFYFGRRFGAQKWAIHYFAACNGYELAARRDLLPHQPEHPRAGNPYYKVQLGPLQQLPKPIPSLKWRRITFIHTTGDRLLAAQEINDLLIKGTDFTNRRSTILREASGWVPADRLRFLWRMEQEKRRRGE
jgi:hypothetical protein